MTETEGVIKFNLAFEQARLTDIAEELVAELSAWRTVLKDLGLLGQVPTRYDGYGFGNVSVRCSEGFLISGTQTGGLDQVTIEDYALCHTWNLEDNAVSATGSVKPSSESLSHASIYDVNADVVAALHVHSPDIWQKAAALGIPVTDPSVPYGTPEMAREVRRLMADMALPGLFSMGGHEDGIFTFGRSLEEAGELMVSTLVKARTLK